MMTVAHKCSRCKKVFSGADEYEAESKYSAHRCAGLRPLSQMPTHILTQLAHKKITEQKAWQMVDALNKTDDTNLV